ncbi:MAG TPA: ABC transporter ATP-binding protein [Rhizobiaceae bacterium]|nr:ABC transporter ATP-binding protein [Rhizobiaceae bacterium]
MQQLVSMEDLHISFDTVRGRLHALRGVNLTLAEGETLALIGESGSGKSVTAEVLLGIVDMPPGRVDRGRISYKGDDLLTMKPSVRRQIQGNEIAMVFQDAIAALNPVYTVGWQIAEQFKVHRGWSMARGREKAVELLGRVGIPNPQERVDQYPHQFSGGMRQRVLIAMAIALEPRVLIADEPTTALDVTVQAQIMQLLARLQSETRMGMMLITHDMAVAAEVADRVAVMYAGRIVETGSVVDIIEKPSHPYTQALVRLALHDARKGSRPRISGSAPDLVTPPLGCAFAPRCAHAQAVCTKQDPQLHVVSGAQSAACHFARELHLG